MLTCPFHDAHPIIPSSLQNPINFHTGLLVLKPDTNVEKDMINSLSSLPSYDGADQGFFTAFFPFDKMMNSPVFFGSGAAVGALSEPVEDPMNRLPPWYNLNALWYYEKGHWGHWRSPLSGRFEKLNPPGASLLGMRHSMTLVP